MGRLFWLAGIVWADHGRHALSKLRKGLWREGERDFPTCAHRIPLCPSLLTREALSVCAPTLGYMPQNKVGRVVRHHTTSTLSWSVCRSMPPPPNTTGPRRYLHRSLNWVSSAVRRGNGHCSQMTSASPCHPSGLTKRIWGSSPAVPVGAYCSSSCSVRAH